MSITARRLNRATLGRQLLLRREPLDVAEAVRRVVALQAQSAASPCLALWNRLAGFDPAGLAATFADRPAVEVEDLLVGAARRPPAAHVVGAADLRAVAARPDRRPVVVRSPVVVRRGAGAASSRASRRGRCAGWSGATWRVRPGLGPGRRPVLPAQEAGGSRRPVGQHPARLRRPRPRDPTGRSPARTATSCRRSWSTATWPGSDVRSRAALKPWRSASCPTRPGPAWPRRRPPWWRSWPTANPWSTAATPTGGTSCPMGSFGCSLAAAWFSAQPVLKWRTSSSA
jgi:hypothetical protein